MFLKLKFLLHFFFLFLCINLCNSSNKSSDLRNKRQVYNIRQYFDSPKSFGRQPQRTEVDKIGSCEYCNPLTGLPDSTRITQSVNDQIAQSWKLAEDFSERQRQRDAEYQIELAKNLSIIEQNRPKLYQPPQTTEAPKIHNQNSDTICGFSSTSFASSYILGGEPIQRGEW